MVEMLKEVTTVIETANNPVAFGPDDLTDRTVVGSSECKRLRLRNLG